MVQLDKTDWYRNGALVGAINNLYYDLINVDVCHVPYSTNHRNSSFFLKTRLAYEVSRKRDRGDMKWYEVTDVKIIWNENCSNSGWEVYVMWRKDWNKKAIFKSYFDEDSNWCVDNFKKITDDFTESWSCWDWKLFITDYVRWDKYDVEHNARDMFENNNTSVTPVVWWTTWIQINEYNLWTQVWLFSDENVKNWRYRFKLWEIIKPWNYILVYHSNNLDDSWFAWQVRIITWVDSEWRIVVDAPWLWFKIPEDEVDYLMLSLQIGERWLVSLIIKI